MALSFPIKNNYFQIQTCNLTDASSRSYTVGNSRSITPKFDQLCFSNKKIKNLSMGRKRQVY